MGREGIGRQRAEEALTAHKKKSAADIRQLQEGMGREGIGRQKAEERATGLQRKGEKMEAEGAKVGYHDPHVPEIKPSRKYGQYAGRKSIPWSSESLVKYDAAIIATAHSDVEYSKLINEVPCIVDTRNVLPKGDIKGTKHISA